jgi:hypothetical protein
MGSIKYLEGVIALFCNVWSCLEGSPRKPIKPIPLPVAYGFLNSSHFHYHSLLEFYHLTPFIHYYYFIKFLFLVRTKPVGGHMPQKGKGIHYYHSSLFMVEDLDICNKPWWCSRWNLQWPDRQFAKIHLQSLRALVQISLVLAVLNPSIGRCSQSCPRYYNHWKQEHSWYLSSKFN